MGRGADFYRGLFEVVGGAGGGEVWVREGGWMRDGDGDRELDEVDGE